MHVPRQGRRECSYRTGTGATEDAASGRAARPGGSAGISSSPPTTYLEEILTLDPVRDHKRIVHLDVCYEFPWDTTRSLELALFRTFAAPSIARLLDSTGEFARAPQKRYDDTDLIISTMLEEGYDSEPGRRALRRMNQIHRRFEISNEDFLYVLSTFVFEPIRWSASAGGGWSRPSGSRPSTAGARSGDG